MSAETRSYTPDTLRNNTPFRTLLEQIQSVPRRLKNNRLKNDIAMAVARIGLATLTLTAGLFGPDLPLGKAVDSGKTNPDYTALLPDFLTPITLNLDYATAHADSPSGKSFPISNGYFYGETVSETGKGYYVTNNSNAPMWDIVNQLGGIQKTGYPLSQQFTDGGRTVQVFQKITIQSGRDTEFDNTYDRLPNRATLDNITDMVPPYNDWSSDTGKNWGHTQSGPLPGTIEENHFRIFDQLPHGAAIKAKALENPRWFEMYGLPMGVKNYNGVEVAVWQRAAFQYWPDKTPWTSKPGEVVVANGGQDAKKYGLIPTAATAPVTYSGSADIQPVQETLKAEVVKSPEKLGQFENKVGWAYSAHPDLSLTQMVADMKRMKALGSDIVYIGHINPGTIETIPGEPGLGPAVWYALKENTPNAGNAQKMYDAVIRALDAASQAGLDVVLPVGYQIQMGKEWNRQNEAELRKNPNGSNMNHWESGETASPYSPKYRQDIGEYYRWVNENIISRYPNILAVNLGDEPMGSDYSFWAKAEFKRRFGTNFDDADVLNRGRFQSEVLADYATWSANFWKEINPGLKTLMTFHIQRDTPFFPNFEAIFRNTPDTFVFSADTHMHDAPANQPLTNQDKNLLYGMVRTLGWLSRVYNRPLMLWSAANSWGLAGESSNPGGIPEARENVRIVTDVAKQNGAKIAMVMAWGWNIEGQGVYRYNGPRNYSPDDMLNQISSDMSVRRDTLSEQASGKPEATIYLPADMLYRRIGAENVSHLAPQLIDLNRQNFVNQNTVYLTDGPALERIRQAGIRIIPSY